MVERFCPRPDSLKFYRLGECLLAPGKLPDHGLSFHTFWYALSSNPYLYWLFGFFLQVRETLTGRMGGKPDLSERWKPVIHPF